MATVSETPAKIEVLPRDSSDHAATPEKFEASTKVKPEPAFHQKETARRDKSMLVAIFDFASHTAFVYHEGRKLSSQDWYPTQPDRDDKSALAVRFATGDKTITAHLHGVWPGALQIGLKPNANAPTCRKIWKPKVKANRSTQSWDDRG